MIIALVIHNQLLIRFGAIGYFYLFYSATARPLRSKHCAGFEGDEEILDYKYFYFDQLDNYSGSAGSRI